MENADARAKLIGKARSIILLGKSRFTITQLAKETRVSKRTIRRYFPTKSSLIFAILDETNESGARSRASTGPASEQRDSSAFLTETRELQTVNTLHDFGVNCFIATEGGTATRKEENLSISNAKITACSAQSTQLGPEKLARHISSSGRKCEDNIFTNSAGAPVLLSASDFERATCAPEGRISMSEGPREVTNRERVSQPTVQSHQTLKMRMPAQLIIGAAAGFVVFMISAGIITSIPPAYARLTQSADGEGHFQYSTEAAESTNFAKNGPLRIRGIFDMAEKGDASAQVQLAQAFLRGDGVKADPATALRWAQIAAGQGEPTAQYILGELYAEGLKPNPDLAFHWFAAAASQGNVKAMHNLAIAFLNGQGVAKDSDTAVYWFTKAANSGYRDSAFDLAVLYERGQGVAQNPRVALRWYDVAAARGDQQAAQQAAFLRSQLPQLAEK